MPIPEDLVEEVFAFVTARRRELGSEGAGSQRPEVTPVTTRSRDAAVPQADRGTESEENEWDADSLLEFLDGANPQLRTLLVYLAEQAPYPVPAEEVIVAAGLTLGRSAGGFLSRAVRSSRFHFGRDLPLGTVWNGERGRCDYWVSRDHADVILDRERRRV